MSIILILNLSSNNSGSQINIVRTKFKTKRTSGCKRSNLYDR